MRFRGLCLWGMAALAVSACGESDDAGGSGGPIAAGDASVVLYDEQPMVVDVELELARTGSVHVEVAADPGVRSESLADAPAGPARVRVRGLAPDQDIVAEVVLVSDGGEEERLPLEFRTRPALAGFQPSFPVTGEGAPGYRLFDQSETPDIASAGLYAVDPAGTTRFYLPLVGDETKDRHLRPPAGIKLEDDGVLCFVQNGKLFRVDEMGTVVLELAAEDVGVDGFHHDVVRMPDGNLLVLGHEFGSFPDPASGALVPVAGDVIVELSPTGEKVWEWSSFDHLDTQRVLGQDYYVGLITNPDGEGAHDWSHGNGIVYRASDDSILLSLRHQDWLVKIDHQSGDILYKLGNAGDVTLESGTWFFHQHSPQWQADGSLLLYDNGTGNPDLADADERSRPVRYTLDEQNLTASQVWDETNEAYMAMIAGDADSLPNGNVLVLDSSLPADPSVPFSIYSRLREVDPTTNTWVWTLASEPNRFIYRTISVDRLPGETAQ